MAKKPSGAHYKKLRRAREARAKAEQVARAQSGELSVGLSRLAALGPPPAETRDLLPWTSSVLGELLYQTLTDGKIDEDKRRSQSATLADKISKTWSKANFEAGLRKAEEALKERQMPRAIRIERGDPNKKGPNSRGVPRGPRPLPPTEEGENE